MNLTSQLYPGFFSAAFLAIVFMQSGLDKVFNYKTELAWIRQKFARHALHDFVGTLFVLLTVSEVVSGVLSLAGFFQILIAGSTEIAMWGALGANVTMLMLIFGQRITKDYTGAASLVPYFLASLMALFFLSGHLSPWA